MMRLSSCFKRRREIRRRQAQVRLREQVVPFGAIVGELDRRGQAFDGLGRIARQVITDFAEPILQLALIGFGHTAFFRFFQLIASFSKSFILRDSFRHVLGAREDLRDLSFVQIVADRLCDVAQPVQGQNVHCERHAVGAAVDQPLA